MTSSETNDELWLFTKPHQMGAENKPISDMFDKTYDSWNKSLTPFYLITVAQTWFHVLSHEVTLLCLPVGGLFAQ